MKTATAKASQFLEESEKIAVRFRVQPRQEKAPLPKKVSRIIKYIDSGCSLAEICQQEQISVEQCQAIVKKLAAQGILQPIQQKPQAMPITSDQVWQDTLKGLPVFGSKDFDAMEEAFFASDVEPELEEDLPPERLSDRLRRVLTALRRKQN